jgi:hypothetical protein
MTITAIVNTIGHVVGSARGTWSWSNKTNVTLALWKENISDGSYKEPGCDHLKDHRRRQHLIHAFDHLDRKVSAVIVTQDPNKNVEAAIFPEPGGQWFIDRLNPKTGAFRLIRITHANRRELEARV